MSKQNNNKRSGGVGILGLLGIAFIVLKLTGYIDWSWWWVTAPFWGLFAIFIIIWLVCVVAIAIIDALDKVLTNYKKDKSRR